MGSAPTAVNPHLTRHLRQADPEGTEFELRSTNLGQSGRRAARGPGDDTMMTWHRAARQRLEPVGPDRHGPRHRRPTADTSTCGPDRRAAPGRRRRDTAAASAYGAGVGPDQAPSEPAGPTRIRASSATGLVLIRFSARPLTCPGSLRNRVISGAEVRAADRC